MSKTLKLSVLRKQYEYCCNEYVQKFVNKQGIQFDGWITEAGQLACFIDQYFFSMEDITYDINNKCPKGLILKWQDDGVEWSELRMNYKSYAKGLRFEDLKEKL